MMADPLLTMDAANLRAVIRELQAEVGALREQIERHVELCGYPFTEEKEST